MRITGGSLRSRRLEAPKGTATRPTSDRVREAIFSMLASDGVFDAVAEDPSATLRVLDLYAGSGALGFEAVSRGATEAVLVEHGRDAAAAIQENVRALGLGAVVRLVTTKVERALEKLEGPFQLVLCDPPYADVRAPGFAAVLAGAAALLAPDGVLLLEHAAVDEPAATPGLALDRTRRHGDTAVSIYRRSSLPGAEKGTD